MWRNILPRCFSRIEESKNSQIKEKSTSNEFKENSHNNTEKFSGFEKECRRHIRKIIFKIKRGW